MQMGAAAFVGVGEGEFEASVGLFKLDSFPVLTNGLSNLFHRTLFNQSCVEIGTPFVRLVA